jgi:type IV pilus assembly protein PilP
MKYFATSLIPLLSLSACSDHGVAEVKNWMDDAKKQVLVFAPKLAEPKKFVPVAYSGKNELDPYNPAKLGASFAKGQSKPDDLRLHSQTRKEALDSYSLDEIKLVGTIQKSGVHDALLQAGKLLFQVKVGQSLGKNQGVITRISEHEIEIKETVANATGRLVERKAKLELQEKYQ